MHDIFCKRVFSDTTNRSYCNGCQKHCLIELVHYPKNKLYRPIINNQIIYDYTPINAYEPQIQLYWEKHLALKKAIEITKNCKHRTR